MTPPPTWIAPGDAATLVCSLIQNHGGVWTCRFHPFEFSKEAA
jgi:hypothetical protein